MMEKISWTDRVRKEVLHTVTGEMEYPTYSNNEED